MRDYWRFFPFSQNINQDSPPHILKFNLKRGGDLAYFESDWNEIFTERHCLALWVSVCLCPSSKLISHKDRAFSGGGQPGGSQFLPPVLSPSLLLCMVTIINPYIHFGDFHPLLFRKSRKGKSSGFFAA